MTRNNNPPVIAIDGPSGVGKGTLCRFLAAQLGWGLLDSGSLYRLVALAAQRRRVPLAAESRLAALAARLAVRFGAGEPGVFFEGEEVSAAIRSETCGNAASRIAAMPLVRAALLQRQRDFRKPPGLVADGRDMGTVVFPDAEVKIFLTASPEERANRRYKQLREKGIDVNLSALLAEIAERDERDAKRQVSPLRAAEDACILDTTRLSIAEVQEEALSIIRKRLQGLDL